VRRNLTTETRKQTLLLSIGIATVLLILAELVGNSGYEASFLHDNNWGANYSWRSAVRGDKPFGVLHLLGVPVFDGAQGLGHRLPNLQTMNHVSPLVLLSRWLPSHALSLLFAWISVVLCWASMDLTRQSWGSQNRIYVRLWVTAYVASAALVFLIHDDWAIQFAGILGITGAIAALFHRSLWFEGNRPTDRASLPVAIFFASALVTCASHPRLLLAVPPVLLCSFPAVLKMLRVAAKEKVLVIALCAVVLLLVLLATELRLSHIPSSSVRGPEGNYFDYLIRGVRIGSPKDFFFVFLTNALLPIVLVSDWAKLTDLLSTRDEFINLFALAWVVQIVWSNRAIVLRVPERRRALLAVLAAIFFSVIWMSLTSESWHSPVPLRLLFNADGWDISFGTTALVIIAAMIGCSSPREVRHQTPALVSWTLALRKVSLGLAVLMPIALLIRADTINGQPARRDTALGAIESITATDPIFGRLGDINRDSMSGCMPLNSYPESLGVSHAIVVSRAGIPTIEASPGFRGANVGLSADGFRQQCDVLIPELLHSSKTCDSGVLDFLNLALILERSDEWDCEWTNSLPEISQWPSRQSESIVGNSPTQYHNFTLSAGLLMEKHKESCVLLFDCLDGVSRSEATTPTPPFTVCTDECWFRYTVLSRVDVGQPWILLPVRFDSAVRVRDTQSADELAFRNYRGLVAANLGPSLSARTLVVSLQPDARMYLIAATPYAALFGYIVLGIAIRRSRLNVDKPN